MIQQLVYLVQTDTTAGFLSQNPLKLSSSKQRDPNQKFLICVDSFKTLKNFTRVPKNLKKSIRRAKKTTYIYPNKKAIRVVKDEEHLKFLKKFHWMYSSSANKTRQNFDFRYANEKADIIVEDERGFFESSPSKIIKISKSKQQRIR
ncbi:Sua5/YciO/YrdC/YwlC family protein [Sulfurospirillum sp. 1307]|jgi:tRNA A37 threonylcarbamoyladenosine synthetase subunit TsaC/SUA5/YrdC